MALSLDDTRVINNLIAQHGYYFPFDERHDRYYEGHQRLAQIGLAVPPELRRFETIVNWPRLAIDSINERLEPRAFMLPGEDTADEILQDGWESNDLDSEAPKHHLDTMIFGRGFVCLGTNGEDAEHPLITVESPRELSVSIDPRTRRVTQAFRLYGIDEKNKIPRYATVYRPDSTSWYEMQAGGWAETDRDDHMLGRVPVIPFYNRLRPGRWHGVSEMADVITLTDAAARSLTNLQIAAETHSVPQRYALGMTKGDFVDVDGKPLPAWEAYYGTIWATANDKASVGQFAASALSNFHETVNHYARLVSALTGLPPHFLGFSTDNPASADAIRSSEARLVKRVELKQRELGDSWGRVLAFYIRLKTGEWPDGRRIKVDWQDASTPTVAARTDAVVKLHAAKLVSREGVWDELGWSDARKKTERAYLEQEANDPLLSQALQSVTNPPTAPSAPISPPA